MGLFLIIGSSFFCDLFISMITFISNISQRKASFKLCIDLYDLSSFDGSYDL